MTTVISTARDALAIFTGRMPPSCAAARHGSANGATRSSPDCGQLGVGLARMFSTFLPMKLAIGVIMMMAAFLAATISPVVELGAADTTSGLPQVPASCALSLVSPMWSPCACDSSTACNVPSRGSSPPVTDCPAS